MNGYQITFFTQQDRRHRGRLLGEWLVGLVKELRLQGATMLAAAEGVGHSGRIHSVSFVELTDRPLEIVTIVTAEEAELLFARLRVEGVRIFYVKVAAEFGTLGE